MRPQSSRPTQRPGREVAASSRDMSASPADAGREEVTRQLGLARQAVQMPAPGDQAAEHRPAELMDAAQQEVLEFHDALVTARAHARAHAAMEAATRLAEGTYGICEACGGKSPPRRLQAVPLTRFCLPCQDHPFML